MAGECAKSRARRGVCGDDGVATTCKRAGSERGLMTALSPRSGRGGSTTCSAQAGALVGGADGHQTRLRRSCWRSSRCCSEPSSAIAGARGCTWPSSWHWSAGWCWPGSLRGDEQRRPFPGTLPPTAPMPRCSASSRSPRSRPFPRSRSRRRPSSRQTVLRPVAGAGSWRTRTSGSWGSRRKDLAGQVKLLSGRMPDQSNPTEVLASYTMQRDLGIRLGSHIRIRFASEKQRNDDPERRQRHP